MGVLSVLISVFLVNVGSSGDATEVTTEDNGQCIPIYCDLGTPPVECTLLCQQQQYVPTCQQPSNICLCQKLTNNRIELISPDEVPAAEDKAGMFTGIFALIRPLESEEAPSIDEDSYIIETVNVHEGRLFYAFTIILTGLFVLILGLIAYEVIMCRQMNRSSTQRLVQSDKITHI